MSATPLRVLVLEDRGTDVELMLLYLRRAGFEVDWEWVDNEKDFADHLDSHFDLILADYRLPQFNALEALHHLQQRRIDTPFLLVSGAIGEELAVDAMRKGAEDFVQKNRLTRLPQAVRRALEQKRLRDEKRITERLLEEREHRYRRMLEKSFAAVMLLNEQGTILYASPGTSRVLGYKSTERVGKSAFEFVHPEDLERTRQLFEQLLKEPSESVHMQYRYQRQDGSWRWLESIETNLLADPEVRAIVDNYHDITTQKELQEELRKLRERRKTE
ncbi:MAG TPA: PAS domain S-box protein [Verrucomicrobiae bacterium]|nr:PAS domain S-box protein [Verrucomicrobiae bacterium]